MSSILIESTPFEIRNLDTDFRHLYLVFVDHQGVESVITAGLDRSGPFNFGDIEVSAGGLLEDSDVARGNHTPGDRGSREIDLGARDPADVWAVMLQEADYIHATEVDYRPLGRTAKRSSPPCSIGRRRGQGQPARRRAALGGDLLEGFAPGLSDPNHLISLSEQADATAVEINTDGLGADTVSLVMLAGVSAPRPMP